MIGSRFETGTVLAGKYRLESLLGEGGMGTVYRAEHLVLQAPVAIKVIDREVAEGDVALSRFMREAQAAASLRSPHVVQILDYGTQEDRPFMVMELLEGETLADRIERLGRLGPQETYRVMSHVARAVAKAHEAGIVHRDLKPDNVFLVFNEGDEIAKVLDFGVAKMEATALEGASHTRTGSLLGTPYYMSPEQAQGNKEIDHRSDLWALSVIAFECMTGQKPFASEGLGDLVLQICIRDIPVPSEYADVQEGFDDWFAKGTQREPDDRFQSARELSEALGDALGVHRDTSIPEAAWSVRGIPGGAKSKVAGKVDEQATTDQDRRKTAADHQETLVDELGGGARSAAAGASAIGSESRARQPRGEEEGPSVETKIVADSNQAIVESGSAQRGSQWELVPHDNDEAPDSHSAAAGSRTSLSDSAEMTVPTRGSAMTVVWVGAVAVLAGVVVVWGGRQLGIEALGGQPKDAPVNIPIDEGGEEPAEGDEDAQRTAAHASKEGSTSKRTGEKGSSAAVDGESGGDQEGEEDSADADASEEDEALDAIDEEAQKSLEEKQAAEGKGTEGSGEKSGETKETKDSGGDKTTSDKTESTSDTDSKEKKKSSKKKEKDGGPSPEVPDTLSPAPPPPPPTE